MERITVFDGEFWAHKNFPPVKDDTVDEFVDCVKELAARLAAYEDTGLEPEEIERILDSYGRGMTLRTENAQRLEIIKEIPINRIRELAQTEKEGRLVVLPCEIGSPVYSHARKLDGADYVRETEFWWSDIPQMSKTVFLTREAAEAALQNTLYKNDADNADLEGYKI